MHKNLNFFFLNDSLSSESRMFSVQLHCGRCQQSRDNIISSDGLVPSGNRPSSEPVLAKIIAPPGRIDLTVNYSLSDDFISMFKSRFCISWICWLVSCF